MYIGSPEAGVLVSNDSGKTFARISETGQDVMGTIWVNPAAPNVAIAPSLQAGREDHRRRSHVEAVGLGVRLDGGRRRQ